MKSFVLTQDHLTLLGAAYAGWDDGEYGAPAMDCKRPYGNSDVVGDIIAILAWPPASEDEDAERYYAASARARVLHDSTETALQIVLQHIGRPVPLGRYVCDQYGRKWAFAGAV